MLKGGRAVLVAVAVAVAVVADTTLEGPGAIAEALRAAAALSWLARRRLRRWRGGRRPCRCLTRAHHKGVWGA